jgi:hypothetical protein
MPATWWKKRGCTLGRFWGGSIVATPAISPPFFAYKYRGREEKRRAGGRREQNEKEENKRERIEKRRERTKHLAGQQEMKMGIHA